MSTVMGRWMASRATGIPVASNLDDADPRLIRAVQILEHEWGLIDLCNREDASKGKGGGRG